MVDIAGLDSQGTIKKGKEQTILENHLRMIFQKTEKCTQKEILLPLIVTVNIEYKK